MSETAWCRADATLHRRTTSAAVVLPAGVDEPLTLAGAAALVWDVLEEPTTSAEAIELLARACGQQPAEIAPHVEEVLGRLSEVGAIEPFGPTPC